MKYLLSILSLLAMHQVFGTTYEVGPTKAYTSPRALDLANVLDVGDTILIDSTTYSGQDALAHWDKDNLVIKGVQGRPHLVANGQYILGKGIWVFGGDNITVENIEFSGAVVPDKNGAGIRVDGAGMTVRYCYFHDNENGILANNAENAEILIEFCEFAYNGHGDGFSHNLYINKLRKLIFRYNYSHHANIGHNLKTRATENHILYNRIMDEEDGNSSRLIDISNGGIAIVMGNLLMQGDNAPNNNLVGYGLEGYTAGNVHELYFVHNTCVNKRQASCRFLHVQNGASAVELRNNIFAGTGTLIDGTATANTNNYIQTDISALLFSNEPGYDYHLTNNSPATDFGMTLGSAHGTSLNPDMAYEHPRSASVRAVNGIAIDVGAYEQGVTTGSGHLVTSGNGIELFPNPFNDMVVINGNLQDYLIKIYDPNGMEVASFTKPVAPVYLPFAEWSSGTYFVYVQHMIRRDQQVYKILKQ